METALDNPIWNALRTGNNELALGTHDVKYFPANAGPFAGLQNPNETSLKELYELLPPERVIVLFTAEALNIPVGWQIILQQPLLQMTGEKVKPTSKNWEKIVPLQKEHIPQMLTLTKRTNPGPFLERTIEFGHYTGIFANNALVAMAGQRLNPTPFAEISAVCTHPDFLGNGYASALLSYQVNRILNEGNIQFLHVLPENTSAIKLYEHLGFVTRKAMQLCVLKK